MQSWKWNLLKGRKHGFKLWYRKNPKFENVIGLLGNLYCLYESKSGKRWYDMAVTSKCRQETNQEVVSVPDSTPVTRLQ